jgi:hypothetical protein
MHKTAVKNYSLTIVMNSCNQGHKLLHILQLTSKTQGMRCHFTNDALATMWNIGLELDLDLEYDILWHRWTAL